MREVIDDVGITWTIYAIVPDAYDDRIGYATGYDKGWLCFQSPEEKRRHPGIPRRWKLLDDMQLLDLMAEARKVDDRLHWHSGG